ncbi:MFS transporter [Nibricoccus aquaticus]|uniref:MFS transporter n=1 Tax=Nibricoccus aquaticus TaxID=2576891 RepID=A0A290QL16_9BACT|nr:MFS transporter [Nibricoccus aquaticus]ATC66078.1 MFS transporter [Nibricoccus aquaticus]
MSSPSVTPPAKSGFRWTICGLLFAATTINYMDRSIIGLLAPMIQKDIGWTEIDYANLNTAFQGAYAIGLLFAGRVIDIFGTKLSYAVAMIFWSVAAIAHAATHTVMGFGVARFFLGLGESGNFPAAIKAVTEWFPKKERALATGIFNSGSNVGAVLAPIVILPLAAATDWRWTFVIIGSLGFVWLLLWFPFFGRPQNSRFTSAEERALIAEGAGTEVEQKTSWGLLLQRRQTWAFTLAKFLTDPVWWFYLLWLPKWLTARGVDPKGVVMPLVYIYAIATVGSVGGGVVFGVFQKRGLTVNVARKTTMALFALFVLPVLFVSRVENLWVGATLMGIALAAHQGWSANLFTTVSDMFPKRAVGSVVGIGGMAGSVGGMIFFQIAGRILESSGNYALLFTICVAAYGAGFVALQLLAPKLTQAEV